MAIFNSYVCFTRGYSCSSFPFWQILTYRLSVWETSLSHASTAPQGNPSWASPAAKEERDRGVEYSSWAVRGPARFVGRATFALNFFACEVEGIGEVLGKVWMKWQLEGKITVVMENWRGPWTGYLWATQSRHGLMLAGFATIFIQVLDGKHLSMGYFSMARFWLPNDNQSDLWLCICMITSQENHMSIYAAIYIIYLANVWYWYPAKYTFDTH